MALPAGPDEIAAEVSDELRLTEGAATTWPGVASVEPEPTGEQPLRHNRDFQVVLAGQGISALGDAVSVTVMPLLVLSLTGSGLALGIVAVLQRLPDLLFGLPAGAYADRWDRRRMMLAADAGRAILTALIPLASTLGWPVMVVILLVSFPINVLRVGFMAAWTASIPNLVGRRNLGRGSGIFEAVSGGSFILGPALAGLAVGQIGAPATLAIDAVSFAVSALSLALIRRPLREATPTLRGTLVHEVAAGVHFIRNRPVLRDAIGFWSAISLVSAPVIPAVTFYVTNDRSLGTTAFGFVISAYSMGTLLGALAASRRMSGGLAPQLLLGNLAVALVTAGVALTASLPLMLVLAFASGAFQSVVLVAYITLRAAHSPDALLGRIGSTARTISVGLQPIGFLAGGILLDAVGGSRTLLVIAALTSLSSILFALSPAIRSAHAWPDEPRVSPS